MDLWLLVLGIVTVLVAIIVPVMIYRRQSPRRKVRVVRDSTSLIARNEHSNDVVVIFKGNVMTRPHVVDVSIGASGRADVGPSSFVGPIVLDLGVKIEKDLTPSSAKYSLQVISDTQVGLSPTLLKAQGKGPTYSGRFLCEGSPVFEVPPCLENVDIEEGTSFDFQKRPSAVNIAAGMLTGAGLVLGFIGITDMVNWNG